MEFFIKRCGSPVPSGPFAVSQIEMMIQMGQLVGDDLVSRDQQTWSRCGDVPQFAPLLTQASPTLRPQAAPTDELSNMADAVAQQQASWVGCSSYGGQAPQPYTSPARHFVGRSHSGMAIGGFACSLVGVFTCLIITIVGLILSCMALSGMKRSRNYDGKGLATAGVVIGSIAIALNILVMLIFFVPLFFARG